MTPIYIIILFAGANQSPRSESKLKPDPKPTMRQFFAALRQVETGGQPNGGRDAIGDNGKSIGPYQIQFDYWWDSSQPGKHANVRNRAYAEKVMRGYWQRYCLQALAEKDFEVLARVHNGGPQGHKSKSTLGYWKRVQAELKRQTEKSKSKVQS